MKILALTNLYPPHYLGGYELIAYAVLNNLQQRGHKIHILTSNHQVSGKHSANEEGIERSLKINGFYGHPWIGMPKLIQHEAFNNRTLLTAIKRHEPNLIYVWNMGGLSKSMVFTLRDVNIPTVFYLSDHWIARGFESDAWLQWWNSPKAETGKKIVRQILTLAGSRAILNCFAPTYSRGEVAFPRIYFCSKALRKLTATAGFDVMHATVIYPPVNTRKFRGDPKPASAPLQRFLWVGRLAEDKGIFTALKAMKLVREKFQGKLCIVGNGDVAYTTQLHNYVKEHQLPVEFSSADMEQMPQIYREHDALLFTSEWAEPFALTPLEAMSSGLPVIGTTTGGSREIFRHGDNALTFQAGNAEELAERMLEMANNPEGRRRIAETGHAEVRANYSEDIIVDQIEKYLEETVETWKPRKP